MERRALARQTRRSPTPREGTSREFNSSRLPDWCTSWRASVVSAESYRLSGSFRTFETESQLGHLASRKIPIQPVGLIKRLEVWHEVASRRAGRAETGRCDDRKL